MQTFEFEHRGTRRRFALRDNADEAATEILRGDGSWGHLGFFNHSDDMEGIRALVRENAELRARVAELEEAAKKQTMDMDILLRGGLEAQHRGAVENSRLRKRIEELEQEVKRTCVHVQAPLPN